MLIFGENIDKITLDKEGFIVDTDGADESTPIKPTAVINPPGGVYEVDQSIPFSAGESRDIDGSIVSYKWDFGDGNVSENTSIIHSYSDAAEYTVTLTIKDNDGNIAQENAYLVINPPYPSITSTQENKSPRAIINSQNVVEVGQKIIFSGNNSNDEDGDIIKYEWIVGDGSKKMGNSIDHVYGSAGKYNVILTVTDDDKLTGSTSKTIVVNEKPMSKTIPDPVLVHTETKEHEFNGREFISFKFDIENKAKYPSELFVPSPELPPCGKNDNASRIWIEIHDGDTDARIYGYCAINSPSELDNMGISVPTDKTPPKSVYVKFHDRKEDKTYTSNIVLIR